MFVVNTDLSFIDIADIKLMAVLRSSNQPLIAAADRPAEPTEAFICSFENRSAKVETHIMLHLLKSGIRVFYSSERGEYALNEYSEVEIDALEFLESMGFMMDSIGFQKVKGAERDELLSGLPIFINPDQLEAEQAESGGEFVSAAELAESLEDVFSDVDLGEFAKRDAVSESSDLLKDLERDLGEEGLGLSAESTKADLGSSIEEPFPVPSGGAPEPSLDSIGKIAKIMSSF